jgi:hypothetical protein
MGANITIAGIGWLIASALGGWLVVAPGFGALAVLAASAGLGCAAFLVAAGRIGQADGELMPSAVPLTTR